MQALDLVDGTYRSPAGRPGLLARACPSLAFYPRELAIVWKAAADAKRGRYSNPVWHRSSLATLRALERAGVRLEVSGVERVAALTEPCVFIGNHMSTLETFVLPAFLLPLRPITYVVKQSLLDYPVFGHIMRSRDPVVVGRTNPRDDLAAVLTGGAERLEKGISMVIFPQTTRTPTFDPGAFNTIGVKLARRAGVPVVPLALKTDAWGNGRWIKDLGRIDPAKPVHIAFGSPLLVRDRGAEEQAAILGFIAERLQAWGGTVRA